MKKKSKLQTLGKFVGHLAMGTVMFLSLLVFTGILHMATLWATPFVDPGFLATMKLLEVVAYTADIVFVAWWAIFSTYKALKEL